LTRNFGRIFPVFHQLISITILSTDNNAQFHLQSLLNRSPYLHSLYFRNEACEILIHSILGMQCEELLIKVKNHESILKLVNEICHLRILQIQYWLDLPFFCWLQKMWERKQNIHQMVLRSFVLNICCCTWWSKPMFSVLLKIWLHLEKTAICS
jgi:hypothetical protein